MEPLLTTEEVADFLRVDIVTVRRLINRGELPAYRIGSEFRFTRADLEDFVKRQRVSIGDNAKKEPFKNFTERARNVMALAVDEALRLEHNYVGTEHLLLGLVSDGEGVAAHVLSNFGIELDKTRNEIVSLLKQGQEKTNPVMCKIKTAMLQGEMVLSWRQAALTGRAKKVISLAVDEARMLGHHYIGSEHLLLGILREGQGLAVGVLENLGVDLEKVRSETLQMLKHADALRVGALPEDAKPGVVKNNQSVKCSHCGALNPGGNNFCDQCHERLS
jgi:excisionase family DNA binding protein